MSITWKSTEESKQATIIYLNQIITKFWDVAVGDRLPFPTRFYGEISTELEEAGDPEDSTPPLETIKLYVGEDCIVDYGYYDNGSTQAYLAYELDIQIAKFIHPGLLWKELGASFEFKVTRMESDITIIIEEEITIE